MARDRKRAKQRRARRGRGDAPTAPDGSTGDPAGEARGAGSPGVGRVERADLPGALEHAGDVDEFDAALVRGAGGVPVDAGSVPADGGVSADPEHLSEREIEDEAEAEGDLSEDEMPADRGLVGIRWGWRPRHS